jgi:hypothetical protein
MANPKTPTSVLYLDRSKIQYYVSDLDRVFVANLTNDLFYDLEIRNNDLLQKQIDQLVQTNKLLPQVVLVVLARDLYFEKDIPSSDLATKDTEIQKFYDTVPFEFTIKKTYASAQATRVIVANRDSFDKFQDDFKKQNQTFSLVVPVSILGPISDKKNLDIQLGKYLLKNFNLIKQFNLIDTDDLPVDHKPQIVISNKSSIRQWALVGVFAALLLILIAVILIMRPF